MLISLLSPQYSCFAVLDLSTLTPPERPSVQQELPASSLQTPETTSNPIPPQKRNRISSLTKRDDTKGLYRIKLEWPEAKNVSLFFYKDIGYMVFDQPGVLAGGTFPYDFFKSVSIIPHEKALIVKFTLRKNKDIKLARFQNEWVILAGVMKNEMPSSLYPLTLTTSPNLQDILFENTEGAPLIQFQDPHTKDHFMVVPDHKRGIDSKRITQLFDVLPSYQGIAMLNKAPALLSAVDHTATKTIVFSRQDKEEIARLNRPARRAAYVPSLLDLGQYDIEIGMFATQKRTLQAKISRANNIAKRLALEEELAKLFLSVGMYHEAAGVMSLIKKRNPNHFYAFDHLLVLYDLAQVLAHNIDDDQLKTNQGGFEEEPERHLIMAMHEQRFGRDQVALKHYIQAYRFISHLPRIMRNDIALKGFDSALAVGFKKPIFQNIIHQKYLTQRDQDQFTYNMAQASQLNNPHEKFIDTYSRLSFSRNYRVAFLARLALIDQKNPHLKSFIKDLESIKYMWRGDILEQKFLGTLSDLYMKAGDTDEALRCLRTIVSYLWPLEENHIYTQKAEDIFYDSFVRMNTAPLLQQLGYYYEFEDITPRGPRYGTVLNRVTALYMKVGLFQDAIKALDRRLQFLRYERKRRTIQEDEFHYLANVTHKRLAELFLMTKRYQDSLNSLDALKPMSEDLTDPKVISKMNKDVKMLKARAYLGLNQNDKAIEMLSGFETIPAQRLRADAVMANEEWVEAFVALGALLQDLKEHPRYYQLEIDAILDLAVVVSHLQDEELTTALINEYADRITNPEKRKAFDIIVASKEPVSLKKNKLEKQLRLADDYASVMTGITSDLLGSTWESDGRIREPTPE